ncbi:pilus assembly protein PilP [Chromatiaceae bacterium AAb-1]|jgi:type IV pilus assembly protein PilO|nr:pilus assembly protein PilP [Chromatiaceae bacterium AAb-1]
MKTSAVTTDPLLPADMADITAWPVSLRITVVVVITGIFILTGYQLLVADNHKTLGRLQQQAETLQQQSQQYRNAPLQPEILKKQQMALQQQLAALQQLLPEPEILPQVQQAVMESAYAAGLIFVSLNWLTAVEYPLYQERSFRLVMRGNYLQFSHFVRSIAQLPYLVSLDDFSVTAEPDKPAEFSVVARTWLYHADKYAVAEDSNTGTFMLTAPVMADVGRDPLKSGLEDSAAHTGASCQAVSLAREKSALEYYPLDRLIFRGYLRRSKHYRALIEDPEKILHQAEVTHYAGVFHGRIIEIAPEFVAVAEMIPDDTGCSYEQIRQLRLVSL